jgi:hypothetical protein
MIRLSRVLCLRGSKEEDAGQITVFGKDAVTQSVREHES